MSTEQGQEEVLPPTGAVARREREDPLLDPSLSNWKRNWRREGQGQVQGAGG